MSTRRVAIIPARGNSKGIPGKNLLRVGGRPLLDYTVLAARECGLFDSILVSSESEQVRDHALSLGVSAVRRPDALAEDHVHSVNVVLDVIERFNFAGSTNVCMLLPTSPLRAARDIVNAFITWDQCGADSLVSVYKSEAHLMRFRTVRSDGCLEALRPTDPNVQRQDMDELYVLNGSIYISTVERVARLRSFHRGNVFPFVMDRHRSIDVDSLEDVANVERVLQATARVRVA